MKKPLTLCLGLSLTALTSLAAAQDPSTGTTAPGTTPPSTAPPTATAPPTGMVPPSTPPPAAPPAEPPPYPPSQQQPYPQQQQYPQQPPPQQPYPQQQPQGAAPPPEVPPLAMVAAPWSAKDARVIVSAERMFGFHAWNVKFEPDVGDDYEASGSMVSLLYGHSALSDRGDNVNPYAIPRIAVDAVLSGFTIGGSIGFGGTSGERDPGGTADTIDLPDASGFAAYVRFGYVLAVNPTIAFWFRGGPESFSFTYDDGETDEKYTTTGYAFTIDPQLIITPVPHAGITLGPLIDVGLSGTAEYEDTAGDTTETDFKASNFGVTAGLALLF